MSRGCAGPSWSLGRVAARHRTALPDPDVWVTETVERGSPDDGTAVVMETAEFAAVLAELAATPLEGQHHRVLVTVSCDVGTVRFDSWMRGDGES